MDKSRPELPPADTRAVGFPLDDHSSSELEVSQSGIDHTVVRLDERKDRSTHNHIPRESSQSLSRFERLPYELRHLIYTQIFSNDKGEPEITVEHKDESETYFKCRRVPVFGTMRALCLTSRQISSEVKVFVFRFCDFNLRDGWSKCLQGLGCLQVLWGLRSYIGLSNAGLIRKITLPTFSIGSFTNLDCDAGLNVLKLSVHILRLSFRSRNQICIGLEVLECLPHSHELFHPSESTTKDSLMLWNWRSVASNHPMRQCFEELRLSESAQNIDFGIYWTEFVSPDHLPTASRQLYEAVKTDYRARLLVVLREWLGARSVRAVRP